MPRDALMDALIVASLGMMAGGLFEQHGYRALGVGVMLLLQVAWWVIFLVRR